MAIALILGSLLAISLALITTSLHRLNFQLPGSQILLAPGELLLQAVHESISDLKLVILGVLLCHNLVKLSLLFLDFKLNFLLVLCAGFQFKFVALKFTLHLTLGRVSFLQLTGQLDELLIFLDFHDIALSPQLACLRASRLRLTPLLIQIATQLPYQLTISLIVSP